MEFLVLILFAALLIVCIALGQSILYALCAGFVLFFIYGLLKGFSAPAVLKMACTGIRTVRNILITFMLIGVLTALWRGAGTIPSLVAYSVRSVSPSIFVLLTFLLNALVSFLTGTSFGTSATMGSVCMTMARSMNLSPIIIGGAILSGAFWGDRCSPVSTSALLTAEITETNIFDNIKNMLRSSIVPTLLSCVIYLALGVRFSGQSGDVPDAAALFAGEFRLGLLPLLPAAVILALALFKVAVKKTMLASIVCAFVICLIYQKLPLSDIMKMMLTGFHASDPALAAMINGGGLTSMLRAGAIVCISSSFSGIFKETGLLLPMTSLIDRVRRKLSSFAVILPISVICSAISCNQTLATMLTKQLCEHAEPDQSRLAIHLENSVIVIAPLIPWSIAGGVPLASVGAPTVSILAACYLYLVPLWWLIVNRRRSH